MRLEKFRVANFRNINDSGWIDVAGTTALVGRNESGKTNLLEALRTVSGPFAGETLSLTRDLPADRMRSEYSDDLEVIRTRWQLDEEEQRELAALLPGSMPVSAVEVWRGYPPERHVEFCGAEDGSDSLSAGAKVLVAELVAVPQTDEDDAWSDALRSLEAAVAREAGDASAWRQEVRDTLTALEEPARAGGFSNLPEVRDALEQMEGLLAESGESSGSEAAATEWVLKKLPPFLYVDEYPDIDGHMDLRALAQRSREGVSEPADRHYETLLSMAGIDAATLDQILEGDPEVRRQIVGRAGAGVTRKLRSIWTDRALKVRFNLDGDHLQTLVCDPNAIVDIEVNLNQRSSGFRWFFSFFIMLTASRQDSAMRDAILLLDEPGLQLHAAGQRDLLRHLNEGMEHQTILATQSPFMIPDGADAAVCTVIFDDERGTSVNLDPDAHVDDFEPIPAPRSGARIDAASSAAPAGLVETLFGTSPVLLVKHVSDFWYLDAISRYFEKKGLDGLPEDLVLLPCGGAVWLPQLMGLLGDRTTQPIVALSERPPAEAASGDASTAAQPLFIGEAYPTPPTGVVELEDLVHPRFYHRFVRAAYRQEIGEKKLEVDPSINPTVVRYENAFAAIDLRFSRRDPAALAVGPNQKNLEIFLSKGGLERFQRLFQAIRERLEPSDR